MRRSIQLDLHSYNANPHRSTRTSELLGGEGGRGSHVPVSNMTENGHFVSIDGSIFCIKSTKSLKVCLFCLWPNSLSHPKRRVVQRRNLARRLVPTMCRPHYVLLVISIGVLVTKIMTFFHWCVQIGAQTFPALASGRSVRPQAVDLHQPAGWLAAAARWPATVT